MHVEQSIFHLGPSQSGEGIYSLRNMGKYCISTLLAVHILGHD